MSADCRLYLISPPRLEAPEALTGFAQELERALGAGDVACLQVRLKNADDSQILRVTEKLMPIAHRAGVAVLINDRADLAKKAGADGVHVGQEDHSLAEARALLGPEASIGVTCHNSRHLAMEAGEGGADYVAFGAFFPTHTKDAPTRADPEILTWWSSIFEIPCVAIGGITTDNCAPLIAAGADFLAVSAGVWDHPEGSARAVLLFNQRFAWGG